MKTDPRSFDLKEDSLLWSMLLQLAYEKYPPAEAEDDDKKPLGIYNALYLLRCDGTKLRISKKHGYGLVPEIDLDGDRGWTSLEAYQAEAQRLLKPHHEKLQQLIGILAKALDGRMPGEYAKVLTGGEA